MTKDITRDLQKQFGPVGKEIGYLNGENGRQLEAPHETERIAIFRTSGENGKIGTLSPRKQASSYETIILVGRRCSDSEARERAFYRICG